MKLVEFLVIVVCIRMLTLDWKLMFSSCPPQQNPSPPASLAYLQEKTPSIRIPPRQYAPIQLTDLAGYHTTTLTHVFFLLSSSAPSFQHMLMDTIYTWWKTFPPCENWEEINDSNARRPQLVFLMGSSSPLEVNLTLLQNLQDNPPPYVSSCFQSISIGLSLIHRNQSLRTRRMLVENILHGNMVRGSRGYGLFLEPHSRPVRANWLSSVALSVRFPTPLFWISGGFQRFYRSSHRISTHFNSIALYRLSGRLQGDEEDALESVDEHVKVCFPHHMRKRPLGSDSFAEFVFFKLFHFMLKYALFATSEQISIWNYLKEFKPNYNVIRFQLAHRLIVNQDFLDAQYDAWNFDKLDPRVLLVQGGIPPLLSLIPREEDKVAVNFSSWNSLPEYHSNSLSHVVLSLPAFQLDKLKVLFRTTWATNPPCDAVQDFHQLAQWSRQPERDLRPQLILLISYRNSSMNNNNEDALKARVQRRVALLSPSSQTCFQPVPIVCLLPLSRREDNHITGSKRMFEYFLRGMCVNSTSIETALYLEPDTSPIKPRWLVSMAASVLFPNANFLIKGSMFLGPKTKRWWRVEDFDRVAKLYFHMNGNALYRINAFAPVYFNSIAPTIHSKKATAMDVDIFEYLLDGDNAGSQDWLDLVTGLRYSDLLGNFYGYDTLPQDVHAKPFVLAHVSAGVDFMKTK